MAPSAILDVILDILLGLDISTGENLSDVDELALERVTGKLDGFIESSKISIVVADTGVEVVEAD